MLPRAFNQTLMSYQAFLREHSSGSRGRTHGSAPTKNLKLTTLPIRGVFNLPIVSKNGGVGGVGGLFSIPYL